MNPPYGRQFVREYGLRTKDGLLYETLSTRWLGGMSPGPSHVSERRRPVRRPIDAGGGADRGASCPACTRTHVQAQHTASSTGVLDHYL